jgi:uncharacterized phage protein gp47/JayE
MTAGLAHELDAHIAYRARNLHTSSKDEEHIRTEAAEYGITPVSATAARGNVILTGSGTVEAGAVLQRGDEVEFTVIADVTITGSGTASVAASVSGAAGNTAEGVALAFVSPVSGLSSQAVVAAGGLIGGGDEEGVESLRARILDRKRNPPQAGATTDYEKWVKEVYPAAKVWVYPLWTGPGTVGVSFVFWDRDSILPTDLELSNVEEYIEARRPAGMGGLEVFRPILSPTNPVITLLPDSPGIRAAVTASLNDLYRRESEPGGTILISRFREALSLAAGESDHILSSPTSNITAAGGYLKVIGTIDWGD